MSWIAVSVATAAGSQLYASRQAKIQQQKAKQDARDAARDARRAEVFAETEGQGQGQIGKVRLGVPDPEIDKVVKRSSLRI